MGGYGDHIVEEIKSRCGIVEVIGRYVPLKRAGSNYKGVCPFHSEKTPSFVVSESKGIFTCFGCGATGDVIEFVKRYHNLDFQGAVEMLAGECGIQLTKSGSAGDERKNKLYEINRDAGSFFYQCFSHQANPGYDYMQKRGLQASVLRKFGIGYADETWDRLYRYLTGKGISSDELLELGLISQSKGRLYDKFRNRVIFPIINTRKKVIGFGGRAIGDGTPKYLNSPESSVFLKKNNLYGLNLTRQDINKEDYAILVEGYMDVISLYQAGVRNVSASLGTALTQGQAEILKRYTKNVTLCYDADQAGQAAALRGMDILRQAGCKVKVFHVTDGKDPDEFIKANGKEAFLELARQALPFADYKIKALRDQIDVSTSEGTVQFLQETANLLRTLSPVEADVYIKKVASETHISEGAIRLEVYGSPEVSFESSAPHLGRREGPSGARGQGASAWPNTSAPLRSEPADPTELLEKNLIRLMLYKSTYIPQLEPYQDVFQNEVLLRIYRMIQSLYKEDEEISVKQLADGLERSENAVLQDIIENVCLAEQDDKMFSDCISHIQEAKRQKRESEIVQILSILDEEDQQEQESIKALTRELIEIQRAKALK